MAQGNLIAALKYASENPNSDFAVQLGKTIVSGQVDAEAQKLGVDLNPIKSRFKQPEVKVEKTPIQKGADIATSIIGGGKLAEGLGKGLAAGQTQEALTSSEQEASDISLALTKRITENKKIGKDTARLEMALNQLQGSQSETRKEQEQVVSDLPTDKEVIGSAVRLGTTLATGAIARGASAITGAGKATTVLGGIVKGTGAGVLAGGAEGVIQGAGIAAEQNKSTEEIVMGGLLGGATGAVVGGAIGSITGGISGAVKGGQIKDRDFLKNLASPKLTEKEKVAAIKSGRFTDPTFLNKAEAIASKRSEKIGESLVGVVDRKAPLGQNVKSILTKIDDVDTDIASYVEKNKVPFNSNQLRTKLNSGKKDLELVFASDDNAEKTYNAVTNAFMNTIKSKDTAGLLRARKDFDKLPAIKKLLESDKLGENARKEIALSVRRSANEYVASLLPKGNAYRIKLTQVSNMIEALENISEKSTGILDKNTLQIVTQKYPLLKGILGGALTYAGLKAIGVGSSAISSTD